VIFTVEPHITPDSTTYLVREVSAGGTIDRVLARCYDRTEAERIAAALTTTERN
jgi:hypothetical protein